MRIIKSVPQLRKALAAFRRQGRRIGFVPTMGYFHAGHLQLMRQAKKAHEVCVVSLYVNPTQFAPTEDLAKYPRDFKRDSSMARKENVDILFMPTDNDIYPKGYLTYVDVKSITEGLCGHFRPRHFRGVATVVAKLLNMVSPDVMYLGQKDAQQVAVLKAMVRDLNFATTIKVVATVREPDGLAMSSRNSYLSPQERHEAVVVYKALIMAKQGIKQGERSAKRLIALMEKMITQQSSGKVQYIACVNANTLEPVTKLSGEVLLALAVYMGKTRLIDNLTVRV